MDAAPEPLKTYTFGRFQVLPHRGQLLADGQPIKLGGRAFDILMALLETPGAVVDKDTLIGRVWPGRVVEEGVLWVQMSALRAAFGAERDLIRTVAGRGYQFTGTVPTAADDPGTDLASTRSSPERVGSALTFTNVTEHLSPLIGRDGELTSILDLMSAHRLVTLAGPGGIGKTRLAVAAALRLLPNFPEGVWLADLSPLSDQDLVAEKVAAAVGLDPGSSRASPETVAEALAGRRILVVLDTCEHLVAGAATMAEALLHASPAARVLVTSREPLNAEGEWVFRVASLPVPSARSADESDPWQYGAVRLFLDRAYASGYQPAVERDEIAAIAAICRRLDGIPLAIELAAARAPALRIAGLAQRLDDLFRVLAGGRRTALPRQQTLRATFEWSYDLLTDPERTILRRLAVFAGPFAMVAAAAVVADGIEATDVVVGLSSLVAKSLVLVEADGAVVRYRLLDTARAYAFEKLDECSEREVVGRRHAAYYRDLFFGPSFGAWQARPAAEWLSNYAGQIDNLRAALDWAFSPTGDPGLGIELTAAATPLWMYLALLEECQAHVERALSRFRDGVSQDARLEMALNTALASVMTYTMGTKDNNAEIGASAWTKALEISESLGDIVSQLAALRGLGVFNLFAARYSAALSCAQTFSTLAEGRANPVDRLVGLDLLAATHHYLGDQSQARRCIELFLAELRVVDYRSHWGPFHLHEEIAPRTYLARILWAQGCPDQAVQAARRCVEDAAATNQAMSLCFALALGACQIALLVDDLGTAEHCVEMLHDLSRRHSVIHWHKHARSLLSVLLIKRGDLDRGLQELRACVREFSNVFFIREFADALCKAGRFDEALVAVESAASSEDRWQTPELLRLKGEIILGQSGVGERQTAQDFFRQALDLSGQQGALSWELRAASSLARLFQEQGLCADAAEALQPVYARFTEGFATLDLRAARVLLDTLHLPEAGP